MTVAKAVVTVTVTGTQLPDPLAPAAPDAPAFPLAPADPAAPDEAGRTVM